MRATAGSESTFPFIGEAFLLFLPGFFLVESSPYPNDGSAMGFRLLSASLQALRPSSLSMRLHQSLGWITGWYGSMSTCKCYLQMVRNINILVRRRTYASIIRSSNWVHNASWTIDVLDDFVWKLQKVRMTRGIMFKEELTPR